MVDCSMNSIFDINNRQYYNDIITILKQLTFKSLKKCYGKFV